MYGIVCKALNVRFSTLSLDGDGLHIWHRSRNLSRSFSSQASPATSIHPDLRLPNTSNSRVQSPAPPVSNQPQQMKDVVNNAFEDSSVANQLDSDLIKQVTEQVIKSLQAVRGSKAASTGQQSQPNPAVPRSPTQSSVDSMPQRYTPPTPEQNHEYPDDGADESSSPEPPPSDSGGNFSQASQNSRASEESTRSASSQMSRETPRPRPSKTDSTSRVRRSTTTTTSPRTRGRDVDSEFGKTRTRGSGSKSTAREGTSFRRDSRDSEASFDGAPRSRVQPRRIPSDVEETTTLEKIWRPLFDNGIPTTRLSELLRGLALHLIDDYEPKSSLVVTPLKMLRFFNETKVEEEIYPWETMFGGKVIPPSLSTVYRKLLCQHHLIQNQNHEQPNIPGLTPYGFEWFMTCLIQAHPATEYERLAKAVMNMPISNADDKTERFPKELSRRLLPTDANLQAEQRLVSAMTHEPLLVPYLKGASSMPPPPPSAPPNGGGFNEPERKPYSQTSGHSNAVDNENLAAPPLQIERERKPYTTREGPGKVHDSDESRPNTSQYRPEKAPSRANAGISRTNSGIPQQTMYNNNNNNGVGSSDPMNNPPRNPHRMSNPPPVPTNGNYAKSDRRSPALRNPYARGEPMDVGSMPKYTSKFHQMHLRDCDGGGEPEDDNTLQRYPSRPPPATSNGTVHEDDSGRGYPIPDRRIPIGRGYEYGSGSVDGGPPRGIPVGTYPSRRPLGGRSNDTRRSGMQVSPTADMGGGGMDRWGNFANGGAGGYFSQQAYGSLVQQHQVCCRAASGGYCDCYCDGEGERDGGGRRMRKGRCVG